MQLCLHIDEDPTVIEYNETLVMVSGMYSNVYVYV